MIGGFEVQTQGNNVSDLALNVHNLMAWTGESLRYQRAVVTLGEYPGPWLCCPGGYGWKILSQM